MTTSPGPTDAPPHLRGRREGAGDEGQLAALVAEILAARHREPARALVLCVQGRRLARALGDETHLAWLAVYGAGIAFRQSRYGLAGRLAQEGLARFLALGSREGEANARNVLGITLAHGGDVQASYSAFHAALGLAREVGDWRLESRALGNLSIASRDLGDLHTSLDWAVAGLEVARAHGDEESVTRILLNTSNLYCKIGEPARAHESGVQAVEGAARLGMPGLLASGYLALSEAERARDDRAAALTAAREALRLSRDLGDQFQVVRAQDQLAILLLELGDPAGAMTLAADGLATARRHADSSGEAQLAVRLGQAQSRLGFLAEARETLSAGLSVAERVGLPEEEVAALRARYELEKEAGNLGAALAAHEAYHLRDKEWFSLEQSRQTRATLVTRQVRELSEANERLSYLAHHDPLTGALNRRAFEEQAGEDLKKLARTGGSGGLSVALLDADHFKRVNDTYGHHVGDEVLRALVRVVGATLRAGDRLARWGGEEFIVLLRGAGEAEAWAAGERVRRAVEAHDWAALHPELRVTASVGVAVRREEASLEGLTSRADLALYAAKHAGRNRVEAG